MSPLPFVKLPRWCFVWPASCWTWSVFVGQIRRPLWSEIFLRQVGVSDTFRWTVSDCTDCMSIRLIRHHDIIDSVPRCDHVAYDWTFRGSKARSQRPSAHRTSRGVEARLWFSSQSICDFFHLMKRLVQCPSWGRGWHRGQGAFDGARPEKWDCQPCTAMIGFTFESLSKLRVAMCVVRIMCATFGDFLLGMSQVQPVRQASPAFQAEQRDTKLHFLKVCHRRGRHPKVLKGNLTKAWCISIRLVLPALVSGEGMSIKCLLQECFNFL